MAMIKAAVKWVEWSNKIGSYLHFYPFTLKIDQNSLIKVKWKTNKQILTSKILGILSVVVLDLAILMILIPILANNVNSDCIVFGTVMIGVISIFSGLQLLMVLKIRTVVDLTIQVFKLEEKYDELANDYGLHSAENPFLTAIIMVVTIVPPFTWTFLCIPAAVGLIILSSSPIRKIVEYNEIWIAFFIRDIIGLAGVDEVERGVLGVKVTISIIISCLGFGSATFNSIYIGQILLFCVYNTKVRILQLGNGLVPEAIPAKAYMEYALLNVLVNHSTAGVLAFFYFISAALTTGICFVVIKYGINNFFVVAFLGILVTTVTMLVCYIQSSVEMKSKSKDFRLDWKYRQRSRKEWAYKYWTSRQDYKIWVGKYFTLEENDLILRIFGDFIIQNVIDLLITFK